MATASEFKKQTLVKDGFEQEAQPRTIQYLQMDVKAQIRLHHKVT